MSNDDSDKKELERDLLEWERSTDAALPSEQLIEESRRSVSKPTSPSSSYPQPMRMQGTVPGLLTPAKKLIFTVAIVFAFLLGFAIAKIYYQEQMSDFEHRYNVASSELGTCRSEVKRCLGEIRSCAGDVDKLTQDATDPSLVPRNFLVERTRKRRDTLQEEYNAQLEKILEQIESAGSIKKMSRKALVALESDILSLRQMGEDLKKAEEEYKVSVVKTANEPTGMSNPELIKRNKARTQYFKNALNKEASKEP